MYHIQVQSVVGEYEGKAVFVSEQASSSAHMSVDPCLATHVRRSYSHVLKSSQPSVRSKFCGLLVKYYVNKG